VENPSRVRMSGPLARYGSGSVEELFRLGYTRQSTVRQVHLMAHLSRWLASEGIQVAGLTPTVADAFLTARRAAGYAGWLSSRALSPLLTYLRMVVAAPLPAVAAASPTAEMLTRYRSYLISERGLQPSSTRVYAGRVRPFLQQRERPDGQLRLAELAARDVSDFLLTIVRQRGSAKSDVTALRSVLGFLHVQGIIAKPLASAVPSVGRPQKASYGSARRGHPGAAVRLGAATPQFHGSVQTSPGRRARLIGPVVGQSAFDLSN